jgi:hypothetical protein
MARYLSHVLTEAALAIAGMCGVVRDGSSRTCGGRAGQASVGTCSGGSSSDPARYHERRDRGVSNHQILEADAASCGPGEGCSRSTGGTEPVVLSTPTCRAILGMGLSTTAADIYRA